VLEVAEVVFDWDPGGGRGRIGPRGFEPLPSARHARQFRRRRSGWVRFVQVRALRQSGVVALSLAGTEAVVTR
jgi:hypothetical protein